MDSQIQDMTKKFELCQQSCGLPPTALWHPRHLLPSSPWSQIHLDYATPITGQMFLDLIDAHTKWLEVFHVAAAIPHLALSYGKCLLVMACLIQWSQTMVCAAPVKSFKYVLLAI